MLPIRHLLLNHNNYVQLNKKIVAKGAIEKVEGEISRLQQIISQRKLASKGGPEGIKAALEIFKSYRDNCRTLQNQCYFQTSHVKMLRALGYASEVNALDFVISIFENPEASTYVHRSQLATLEKQLDTLKKYPQEED